ncbi:chondroitin sulfate synthase 1 [Lingula anatina]|uniref:Hexosyltransferase n=1 Tax=Lingula anatina TaxID=7574 RepID=A0A1S3JT82_LINAN|nr:chondroitin sulfate synthase 1 [Lingula anatina]|eukprot:XP_013413547.1 chondroitin sulfate synthase 1 [Lingula anatina]
MVRPKRHGGSIRQAAIGLLVGLLVGFAFLASLRHQAASCLRGCCTDGPGKQNDKLPIRYIVKTEKPLQNYKKSIFVGVMTAKKYLDSRAVAAHRTWAKTIPGEVAFFSSAGSHSHYDIPIVSLTGVDDSYPPVKKSFMMIKYMHDHYLDKYDWFVRADDDVYIKGDSLSKFLHSINNSKPQFIGQAGLGTKEEFGKLSLDGSQNFCMGGPGVVFSKETLRKLIPHISYCLKNLYSTHEDVEVGRCVQRFVNIPCTWAFEMQSLFYQNYEEESRPYTNSLNTKDIHRAITLHPLKQPPYLYRLHNFLQARKSTDLRHKILFLHQEERRMSELIHPVLAHDHIDDNKYALPPSLTKFVPNCGDEVPVWEFLTRSVNTYGNHLHSHYMVNPKVNVGGALRIGLQDILMQMMQMINKNARQRGRTIDFKEILYGYTRINPLHGAEYVLDLLLTYRKHKGRRMTVPVRRHAYLQQQFAETEFREDAWNKPIDPTHIPSPETPNLLQLVHDQFNKLSYFSNGNVENVDLKHSSQGKTIHFILPLSGRLNILQQFMHNFEKVCLELHEDVKLVVINFPSATENDARHEVDDIVQKLKDKYPSYDLRVIHNEGIFSRGVALQQGSAMFDSRTLLFFVDVDITFNNDALQRIRSNTIRGQQVYFPVVFSQYDPAMVCNQNPCPNIPFVFTENIGYWRQFGYGIVSAYKSDFMKVGGFDTTIQGWGKEDVDLFTKFVTLSNLTIFRSVDLGLVHIFHPIHCDPNLDAAQYQMCLGSKAASFAPVWKLSEMVYNIPDIFHRNPKEDNDSDNDNIEEKR